MPNTFMAVALDTYDAEHGVSLPTNVMVAKINSFAKKYFPQKSESLTYGMTQDLHK